MGGNGTKQAGFAWSPSEVTSSDASVAQQPRPEAPPKAGAGGARGAMRKKAKGGERLRAVEMTATRPLPPDNELWDVHAAATFLKRSVSWVYHKAEDGTLPVKRLGGWGVRFVATELRAWVDRPHTKTDGGR